MTDSRTTNLRASRRISNPNSSETHHREGDEDEVVLRYTVSPESWRSLAYLMFWSMCILALIFTKTLVKPLLAKGPNEDGSTCGPFNRNDPEIGVFPGEGFDFDSQNHLKSLFGYSK